LPSWKGGRPAAGWPSAEGQPCEDRAVVPADIHDFFVASAGVAGALIGLLFVAISVAADRLATESAGQLHRIRAYAALVAFTNALAVSLFAMIPGEQIGTTALVVAIVGLLFVAAALISLIRLRQVRWSAGRDALFLVGLAVVLVFELLAGIDVIGNPRDSGSVNEIAILVSVCFLIGIARAWELIGGPSIGITHEVVALVRRPQATGDDADNADTGTGSPEGDGADAEGAPPT
jgi:hypothetical protein